MATIRRMILITTTEQELERKGYKEPKGTKYTKKMEKDLRTIFNVPKAYYLCCYETPCYDSSCEGECGEHETLEIEFTTWKVARLVR